MDFYFLNFDFIYFLLQIPMYGFGGHARLIAKGVPRDGAGRMWLMLHQDSHKTEWGTSFLLQNFGDLKAFIKIKPISKGELSVWVISVIIVLRGMFCVWGSVTGGFADTVCCKVV
jgi:hypothetical protein